MKTRWVNVPYFLFCLIAVCSGCRQWDSDADRRPHPVAELEHREFLNWDVRRRVVGYGREAMPYLIQQMLHAPGDIEWKPGDPEEQRSPRFCVQWCIKQIIRSDFLARHPEYKYLGWIEVDNSLCLIRWWLKEGLNVIRGGNYALPVCMKPGPPSSTRAGQEAGSLAQEELKRYADENGRFKASGYSTLAEFLAARLTNEDPEAKGTDKD